MTGRPPKHYNPSPMFGLREPAWRSTPEAHAFSVAWIAPTYRTLRSGSIDGFLPLKDGDLIVYANDATPDEPTT